ncbi:NlpC/P60 family protein [Allokutzneria sp. A3M-2-11 16]|uniref:NlpC/P60 family protein n=1 Tax=Allokutzneria sp. A3M-2-11 16 TaxID=2962043 RepID=UPI0020B766BA|nr:NlpC/P60 family protein [Allokutzneria sp. A3M-2-11 16]MCP3802202.1 NlpC/P60 family protein [Allokutzneria sp. A3M-2-11 16]
MSTRRSGSTLVSVALAMVTAVGIAGTAQAVPPPPPNPSDTELQQGRVDVDSKAGEVGKLTNQLTQAETKLLELSAEVQLKMEDANKAQVDLDEAEAAAVAAKRDADGAKAEAEAAGRAIEEVRKQVDAFASSSYQQGSTVGSIRALMGVRSADELLERLRMLDAASGSQLTALDNMQRARTDKANKDSLARKALEIAKQKEDAAEAAKRAADVARAAAVTARAGQERRAEQLENERSSVERQLEEARNRVSGLQNQRRTFENWQEAKRREEAELARQAAEAAAAAASEERRRTGGGGTRGTVQRPTRVAGSGAVQIVINRALSQLGVIYAWGGGNGSGPTRGIRDGGVADVFGDYRKIGFDCSGLMIYAFAGVGINLAHYSGYQYNAGRKVPLSQMQPGDMLFWAHSGGRIHHVAMYIGGGRMVEAPFSGARVRVTSVRYGGIMPYATRLL